MKQFLTAMFLIVCIGKTGAVDLGSYEFIDTLLNIKTPAAPVVFDDAVIFTAPSSWRRVGVSFAHEGFSTVHWMKQLLYPRDPAEISDSRNRNVSPYVDSGILFHVHIVPEGMRELDYRMIIDGLWTSDPLNPLTTANGGITQSRVIMPSQYRPSPVVSNDSGFLRLSFNAPAGELVTVGGSFNNWDPFMYTMKETGTGSYSLILDLPPGTYQYVFFYRGERLLDPLNPERIYTKDGKPASQVSIRRTVQ